jgi:hypothetical protein
MTGRSGRVVLFGLQPIRISYAVSRDQTGPILEWLAHGAAHPLEDLGRVDEALTLDQASSAEIR